MTGKNLTNYPQRYLRPYLTFRHSWCYLLQADSYVYVTRCVTTYEMTGDTDKLFHGLGP